MSKHQIVIAGAGGMGSATGLLLRELGDFEVDLFVGDGDSRRAENAAAWILEGSERQGEVAAFRLPAQGSSPEFEEILARGDILLDCLPGSEAPRMAELARKHGLHYANLTEHVRATAEIQRTAAGAEKGFLLQTGLAPGFVNVLGHGLYLGFCRQAGVTTAESLVMRVGALTPTARAPHFYGFTWSSIGVATEYLEASTVIRDFQKATRPSLAEVEAVTIDGVVYEEALTSGGAADLPDALQGKVRNLDYKTLRYPGHYGWVKNEIALTPPSEEPAAWLLRRMLEVVPFAEEDLVVIHAAVEGRDRDGTLRRLEDSRLIRPRRVGAHRLKAIQTTTCAGLAESARLLLTTGIQGVHLQSQIDPDRFMDGPFVSTIYGD
jgi:saccharopine dehydrogenase-like NADP-dependent oxidoreductase